MRGYQCVTHDVLKAVFNKIYSIRRQNLYFHILSIAVMQDLLKVWDANTGSYLL